MKSKLNDSKKTLELIKKTICFDLKMWIISVIGAVLTAIPWFATIFLDGYLMSKSVERIQAGEQLWGIVFLCISVLIFLRVQNIVGYGVNSWAAGKITGKLQNAIIGKYFLQKERDSLKYSMGDIMSRITNDCGIELADFYFQGFGLSVVEPLVTGILGLIVVGFISIRILLFSIIMGICTTSISFLFTGLIKSKRTGIQKKQAEVSETFLEILEGSLVIRLFQKEEENLKRLNNKCVSVANGAIDLENNKSLLDLIINMLELVTLLGLLILGVIEVKNGVMKYTSILIIYQMQALINNMISCIGKSWNYLSETSVYSERIFEILDEKDENVNEFADIVRWKEGVPAIEINNLDFSYDENNKILSNINMRIETGQKVAIVGESGCGKSTLIKQIFGLYSDYEGELKLFGNDLKDSNLNSWRSQISIVQQESELFDRSLLDNISLGYKGKCIGVDSVMEAAKAIGAHDFIEKMPEKYETIVGEKGKKLSGGQRQRINIARALLRDTPIILLDEPTSSLDSTSEMQVKDALDKLMKDRTVVMVTHRLNIIKDFNNIYVMKDGNIIDQGSYEEILSRNGDYFNLTNVII